MELRKTDPAFLERFNHFVTEEVAVEEGQTLDAPTRYLAILATLIGCGGVDAYREILPQALENGLTPIAVKECVYQATDYLGYGRMLPFLYATNEILTEREIALPLVDQTTTTFDDRLEKGIAAQVAIFGEHMNEAWKKGTHPALARGQLFRRLLHPYGAFSARKRTDHVLFSHGAGRM